MSAAILSLYLLCAVFLIKFPNATFFHYKEASKSKKNYGKKDLKMKKKKIEIVKITGSWLFAQGTMGREKTKH